MLKCSDKNGLVIQGNGQRYEFKNGDAVPERIFEKDFPANSGIEFKDALIEAGRIKETKEKEEVKKDEKDSKSTTTK